MNCQCGLIMRAFFILLLLGFKGVSAEIKISGPTTVKFGNGIRLQCSGQLPILWLAPNGSRLSDSNNNMKIFTMKGKGVLIIHKAGNSDSGKYTCRDVTKMSAQHLLTVEPKLEIIAPTKQSAVFGQNYTIKCRSVPILSTRILWQRNGESIDLNDRYEATEDGLLIKNVSLSDEALYQCQAAMVNSKISKLKSVRIQLDVIVTPTIISKFTNYRKFEGDSFQLACEATGDPKPSISWKKGGKPIPHDDVLIKGKVIEFTSVNDANKGYYECVASNRAGISHSSFFLVVMIPPVITISSKAQSVVEGESVAFKCFAVKGNPKPALQWYYFANGKMIEIKARENTAKMYISSGNGTDESSLNLHINNVTPSDAGSYQCLANNQAGVDQKNASLFVQFPPKPSDKVSRIYFGWIGGKTKLNCSFYSNPRANLYWLRNKVSITDSGIVDRPQTDGLYTYSDYTVTHINKYDFGEYTCRARNTLGEATLTLILKEVFKPKIPRFNITNLLPSSVTLTVTEKFNDDILPSESYIFTLSKPNSHDEIFKFKKGQLYQIDHLTADTEYLVTIAARNRVGVSDRSEYISFRTPTVSSPYEPIITSQTDDIGQLTFLLRWIPSHDGGQPITHYEINVDKILTDEFEQELYLPAFGEIRVDPEKTFYLITRLSPETKYKVSLSAHNSIGGSSKASILVKTHRGPSFILPPVPPRSSAILLGSVCIIVVLTIVFVDASCYKCNHGRGVITSFFCYHMCPPESKSSYPQSVAKQLDGTPYEIDTLMSKSHGTHIV